MRIHASKASKLFAAFLIALLVAPAAFADQWIHFKVEGPDDERVTVNLPMSMVRSVAAMIPADVKAEVDSEMRIAIDELDMEWEQFREFWQSVKEAPEATFATVQTRDESFSIKKEAGYLMVQTDESSRTGTEIDVKLPMNVVDALFSGPEGTLNFVAALDALASDGHGHLVSIRDGEETVQVWIDGNNLAD
ncbi:MAG: hypothetical protein AAFX50_02560 [Acidobacteriota bacterium]